MKVHHSSLFKKMLKRIDSILSSKGRLFSRIIEIVLNIKNIRNQALLIDVIRFYGPEECEAVIRSYVERRSFPKYAVRMLKRYPVIVVFAKMPVRGHTINDVAFFHELITTDKEVEKLLTRAVYRSFLQKAEKLGVPATYCNIDRMHAIFHRRFHTNKKREVR